MHKKRFTNRIKNNICLTQNLTYMLRTQITCNLNVKISKYVVGHVNFLGKLHNWSLSFTSYFNLIPDLSIVSI